VIAGTAAIAGIGATEFSKDSGRSELRLAVEAVRAAVSDAGLALSDVDGLVTFTMDGTAEIAVARELGLGELHYFGQVGYGGGAACGVVAHAAMAVATGLARVVVCYRALNERSGRRFGQVSREASGAPTSNGVDAGWHYPMGLGTPAAMVAMLARRYLHEYGASTEDLGRVAVAMRRHAAVNRPRGSTAGRSRSPRTRRPGGSPNRCDCWTAARRATARWRSWSPRPNWPAIWPSRRRSCVASPRAAPPAST
jgi:acetyl-CoA acetyltransferase